MCRRRLSALSFLSIIALFLGVTGCARVDPRADYQRAGRDITARLGVQEVYDPAADAMIDAKVARLLEDSLTVDEAVRVALLNNRGFQALFHTIGASRADVVQSGLLSNPTLGLSVMFPEGGGRSKLGFGFAQQIVDLWQIPIRKRVAQADLDRTVLVVLQQAVDLTADVRMRSYQLLALQRSEQIARENLELAQQTLTLAQRRFEAGQTGLIDVNLVRGRWLEVRRSLIIVRRDREQAELALARFLGLSRSDAAWSLKDDLAAAPAPTMDDAALVARALEQRYDLRAAAAEVAAAEGRLEREFLNVFPNVTIGLDGERSERRALTGRKIAADTARSSIAAGQLTAPAIESRAERDQRRREIVDFMIGPSLDITLPIWDQNQAQIAKARFDAIRFRKMREDLSDAVARAVRESAVAARAAAELVQLYEQEVLPLADESLANARRLYESGDQSVIVLLDAQEFLIRQRAANVDVIRDASLARTELERALGGALPVPATQPTP